MPVSETFDALMQTDQTGSLSDEEFDRTLWLLVCRVIATANHAHSQPRCPGEARSARISANKSEVTVIREHLPATIAGERHFQWRGGEITRLEHFSDAVFAFAVTLLVVSLEVPKSLQELMTALRGFVAFAVCFAMLVLVWLYHCRFFRRYGLQDGWVTFLNSLLLFFVLFYVYPLKFLAVVMFGGAEHITGHDIRTILVVYGCGYAALWLTFAWMYLHAWRKRDQLALNEIERLRTRHIVINHFAMAVIGLCSVLLALVMPERQVGLSGYFYFVIPVYFLVARFTFRRRERHAVQSTTTSPPLPAP
jgi:uncharacterized membrane protein